MAKFSIEAESANANPDAAGIAGQAANEFYCLECDLHELEALTYLMRGNPEFSEDQQMALGGIASLAGHIRDAVKKQEGRFNDLAASLKSTGNVAEFKRSPKA